ncbi:ribosome-associated heat shock protein Hsp15 [Devosia subaequoris]|uniref:Ribosome-associated heat shock protein Hsp15 n=1 Tax=Devosia subaequoris TaxID=395930 RepID=A0A7W6IMX7_9HYPH|nr:RNA-binding S4 domain-containing protein [Devosia subaequoris]MBB4052563.1 ribosome-associated heat shock protein Hsp15 [Devosia subaequoris]MCP1209719.1 RNA-binding S4 domain-containing protein [Devosia subaequoris]
MAGLEQVPLRKERLDRFLFFSRAVKSRTLAQKIIESGAIRVNSEKTERTDLKVGAGDVLTMSLHNRIVIWRILDCGTRRGPASEAQGLYEDISPPPVPRAELSPYDAAIAERPAGAGRPTKKERRETDRLRGGDVD